MNLSHNLTLLNLLLNKYDEDNAAQRIDGNMSISDANLITFVDARFLACRLRLSVQKMYLYQYICICLDISEEGPDESLSGHECFPGKLLMF